MASGSQQADIAPRLQKDAIGLAQVLFQSITHMAPAAAVAFSIIFAVTYAGGATPLAVLLALVACLLVAISIGQLARHLPSAGGLYTYSARALHPAAGFFVAWGFMLAEPLVAPLLYLIFGNVIASSCRTTSTRQCGCGHDGRVVTDQVEQSDQHAGRDHCARKRATRVPGLLGER